MSTQHALLLIADIAGYTRFMKFHAASLMHAQDVVGQLLEAMIDAVGGRLKLVKIEGDAAFFSVPLASATGANVRTVVDDMYRAFHAKAGDLKANTLCPCDGCQQAGQLKVKFVGHAGDVVERNVGGSAELAGVSVILVHRLLKNRVPVGEYLLVTEPVYASLEEAVRAKANRFPTDVDDLGHTLTWYLPYAREGAPDPVRQPLLRRLVRHLGLMRRTVPYVTGRKQACADFRNLGEAAQ
jgi:class 3 adenylate cyclase